MNKITDFHKENLATMKSGVLWGAIFYFNEQKLYELALLYGNRAVEELEQDKSNSFTDLWFAMPGFERGVAKLGLKDYAGAIQDFNKVLGIAPKMYRAYRAMATAKACLGDYAGAIDDIEKYVDLLAMAEEKKSPEGAKAYAPVKQEIEKAKAQGGSGVELYFRGVVQYYQSCYGAAIELFSKAIDLSPQFVYAYRERGRAKAEMGDNAGAIQDYDKFESFRVLDAYERMYNFRGIANEKEGSYGAALYDYTCYAVYAQNTCYGARAHNNRGRLYLQLGDMEAAIADFNIAIKTNPMFVDALANRAKAYIRQREYEKALEDCNTVLDKIGVDSPQAEYCHKKAAASLLDREKIDVVAQCNRRIAQRPTDAMAYVVRGIEKSRRAAYANSDDEFRINMNLEAIADISEAIEIEPTLAKPYYHRAKIKHDFFNDDQGAIEDYKKAIELYEPENSSIWLAYSGLKDAMEGVEDYSGAIAALSKQIDIEPASYAYVERAEMYFKLKDYENVLADISKAKEVEVRPDLHTCKKRAEMYFELKDYENALADINKAKELGDIEFDSYYLSGKIKFALQDYKGALVDFDNVGFWEFGLGEGELYYCRACTKEALGDMEGAAADFAAAKELEEEDAYSRDFFHVCDVLFEGKIKFFMQDYKGALVHFNDVVVNKVAYRELKRDAYYYRAYTKEALGDREGAAADFAAAKEFESADETASKCLLSGKIKYFMKDYKGALVHFDKAIADNLAGKYVKSKAYHYRACTKEALGYTAGAAADFAMEKKLDFEDSDEE